MFLAITFVPLFGIFLGTFTPVPLTLTYCARGRFFGLISIGAALTVVGAFFLASGAPWGGLVFLEYCILGGVLGEGLLRRFPPGRMVALGAGAVIGFGLILLMFTSSGDGGGLLLRGKSIVERQVRESLKLYDEILSSPQTAEKATEALNFQDDQGMEDGTRDLPTAPAPSDSRIEPLVKGLIRVFPGLMLLGTALVSWANFLMARIFLIQRKVIAPEEYDLKRWQAPENLVWLLIASGFALFLFSGGIASLGLNGLIILGLVYFFQGLAIVAFWMERKNAPRFFRILAYTLIGLQQYLTLGVALLGLFDMWIDFRKLKTITGGDKE